MLSRLTKRFVNSLYAMPLEAGNSLIIPCLNAVLNFGESSFVCPL